MIKVNTELSSKESLPQSIITKPHFGKNDLGSLAEYKRAELEQSSLIVIEKCHKIYNKMRRQIKSQHCWDCRSNLFDMYSDILLACFQHSQISLGIIKTYLEKAIALKYELFLVATFCPIKCKLITGNAIILTNEDEIYFLKKGKPICDKNNECQCLKNIDRMGIEYLKNGDEIYYKRIEWNEKIIKFISKAIVKRNYSAELMVAQNNENNMGICFFKKVSILPADMECASESIYFCMKKNNQMDFCFYSYSLKKVIREVVNLDDHSEELQQLPSDSLFEYITRAAQDYILNMTGYSKHNPLSLNALDRAENSLRMVRREFYQLKRQIENYERNFKNNGKIELNELKELIDLCLRIGDTKKAANYISQFTNLLSQRNQSLGTELFLLVPHYGIRNNLLSLIKELLSLEESLLWVKEDDITHFIINHPEDIEQYQASLEAWKNYYTTAQNASILFVRQTGQQQLFLTWRVWCWLPEAKKPSTQPISSHSLLFQFLERTSYTTLSPQYSGDIIELLTMAGTLLDDPAAGTVLPHLTSKRDRIIVICNELARAYRTIGHDPFANQYRETANYYTRLKNVFPKELMAFCANPAQSPIIMEEEKYFTRQQTRHITPFPVGLFPVTANFGMRTLNDPADEIDLFENILPSIDKIKGLELSFNLVHDVDWQLCANREMLKMILAPWCENYEASLIQCPYQRKYFLCYVLEDKEWYFYGKAINNRPTTGFLHEKQELKELLNLLEKFELAKKLQNNDVKNTALDLKDQENRLLAYINETLKVPSTLNQQANIFKTLLESKDIETAPKEQLYDITNSQEAIRSRDFIIRDKAKPLACIVRVARQHYIALLVTPLEQHPLGNGMRTMFVMDSGPKQFNIDQLRWFTGVIDHCAYLLEVIDCPKQKSVAEDSLLHAFFNAKAALWAWNNQLWEFFKNNLYRQYLSHSENIEKIKYWMLHPMSEDEVLDGLSSPNRQEAEQEADERDTFSIHFKILIELLLNPLHSEAVKITIESFTKNLNNLRRFNEIPEYINFLIDYITYQNNQSQTENIIINKTLEKNIIEDDSNSKNRKRKSEHPEGNILSQSNKRARIEFQDASEKETATKLITKRKRNEPNEEQDFEKESKKFKPDIMQVTQNIISCFNQQMQQAREKSHDNNSQFCSFESLRKSMFNIIQEVAQALLSYQETLSRDFESFEDKLHHALLVLMTKSANKHYSIWMRDAEDAIKNGFAGKAISVYTAILTNLKPILEQERQFCQVAALITVSDTIQNILAGDGQLESKTIIIEQIAARSLAEIGKFIPSFYLINQYCQQFSPIFNKLLCAYFEPMPLPAIDKTMSDITNTLENTINKVSYAQNFIDLMSYVAVMIDQVKWQDREEGKLLLQALTILKEPQERNDQRLAHCSVVLLIKSILENIKSYLASLSAFRRRAIEAMKQFEEPLHQAFLISIEHALCKGQASELAYTCLQIFPKEEALSYEKQKETYLNVVKHAQEQNLVLKEIGQSLTQSLQDTSHSHIGYLSDKFNELRAMIIRFADIEANVLKLFPKKLIELLNACYEERSEEAIYRSVKNNIDDIILHQSQDFIDLEICISALVGEAKWPEKSFTSCFEALKQCIVAKDERSVHCLSAALRELIRNQIDAYLESLINFRAKTLDAVEKFQKMLHQHLTTAVQKSIEEGEKTNLATDCHKKLNPTSNKINVYLEVVSHLKIQNIFDSAILDTLKARLQDTNHSHTFYLARIFSELEQMLKHFVQLEDIMPDFSALFLKWLNEHYDQLPEQQVFGATSRLQKETVGYLKQAIGFDDIETMLLQGKRTDSTDKLCEIIKKCQELLNGKDEKGSAEISHCMRGYITILVAKFGTELLGFRYRALKTFIEFEKQLAETLFAYENFKNANLRQALGNILINISNSSGNANSIYQDNHYDTDLYYYKEVLQLTKNLKCPSREKLLDLLKETTHTLIPHLQQKINELKKILDSYVNWYRPKSKPFEEGYVLRSGASYYILELTVTSGILSEIIGKIKPEYFCPNNEIRIISTHCIYINVSLADPRFAGLNIVLISPNLTLVDGKSKFTINTNGKNADDVWVKNPAKKGMSYDEKNKGNKGEDGCDGKAGKSAGNVFIIGNRLPEIEVTAFGGKGGCGQDGGEGAPGKDGEDGRPACKSEVEGLIDPRVWGMRTWSKNVWSYRARRIGTDGKPGGCGGDAGTAGYAGDMGEHSNINLISLKTGSKREGRQEPVKEVIENGVPGKPGEAGKHGKDGIDYVGISNSGDGRFFNGRTLHIKGGRLESNERQDCQEGPKFWDSYKMLSMENKEDDSRFQGKYPDIVAIQGTVAAMKHKNQELVTHIHAINPQNVYQQTTHFFDEFNNVARDSFAHWWAPSLNDFLANMAATLGLPPAPIQVLPDVGKQANELLQFSSLFKNAMQVEQDRVHHEKLQTSHLGIGIELRAERLLQLHQIFKEKFQARSAQLHEEIACIDVNKFSRGLLLSDQLLLQLEQHATIMEKFDAISERLQKEIDAVDLQQLATGLTIRSTEIANLRREVNQILNEQRFAREMIVAQERAHVLLEIPKENLSEIILKKYNVAFKKMTLSQLSWQQFKFDTQRISREFGEKLSQFNTSPDEDVLIEIGSYLSKTVSEQSQDGVVIAPLLRTYLDNLLQADFDKHNFNKFSETTTKFYGVLENNKATPLLPAFINELSWQDYRHECLVWIKYCLLFSCGKPLNRALDKFQQYYDRLLKMLRTASAEDYIDLVGFMLSSPNIIKEFNNNYLESSISKKLIEQLNAFNQFPAIENFLDLIAAFSKLDCFHRSDSYYSTLSDDASVYFIEEFINTAEHNLYIAHPSIYTKIDRLIKPMRDALNELSYSYFQELIDHFSLVLGDLIILNNKMTDDHPMIAAERRQHIDYDRINQKVTENQVPINSEIIKSGDELDREITTFLSLRDFNSDKAQKILFSLLNCNDNINYFKDKKEKNLMTFLCNVEDNIEKITQNTLNTLVEISEKRQLFNYRDLSKNAINEIKFLFLLIKYHLKKRNIAAVEQPKNELDQRKIGIDKPTIETFELINQLFEYFKENHEQKEAIVIELTRNIQNLIEVIEKISIQSTPEKILAVLIQKGDILLERAGQLVSTMRIQLSAVEKMLTNNVAPQPNKMVDDFEENVNKLNNFLHNVKQHQHKRAIFIRDKAVLAKLEILFTSKVKDDKDGRDLILCLIPDLSENSAIDLCDLSENSAIDLCIIKLRFRQCINDDIKRYFDGSCYIFDDLAEPLSKNAANVLEYFDNGCELYLHPPVWPALNALEKAALFCYKVNVDSNTWQYLLAFPVKVDKKPLIGTVDIATLKTFIMTIDENETPHLLTHSKVLTLNMQQMFILLSQIPAIFYELFILHYLEPFYNIVNYYLLGLPNNQLTKNINYMKDAAEKIVAELISIINNPKLKLEDKLSVGRRYAVRNLIHRHVADKVKDPEQFINSTSWDIYDYEGLLDFILQEGALAYFKEPQQKKYLTLVYQQFYLCFHKFIGNPKKTTQWMKLITEIHAIILNNPHEASLFSMIKLLYFSLKTADPLKYISIIAYLYCGGVANQLDDCQEYIDNLQNLHEELIDHPLHSDQDFPGTVTELNNSRTRLEIDYITIYLQQSISTHQYDLVNLLDHCSYSNEIIHEIYKQICPTVKNISKSRDNFEFIAEGIYKLCLESQNAKMLTIQKFLGEQQSENDLEHFKKIIGYIDPEKWSPNIPSLFSSSEIRNVSNFQEILTALIERLTCDGGLLIEPKQFTKILDVLACFEDIEFVTTIFFTKSQPEWLATVLQENILEKYYLLYKSDNDFELIRSYLTAIDQKLLLLFNNVLIKQNIHQIYERKETSNTDQNHYSKVPPYQKLHTNNFIRILQFMENIIVDQNILDQLAEAFLAIWDTILYEVQFSQRFSQEILATKIRVDTHLVEKCLLFLNRIRIDIGIINSDQFYQFLFTIFEKIKLSNSANCSLENLHSVLKAIYYQKISQQEGQAIISSVDYDQWHLHLAEIEHKKGISLTQKISDYTVIEIIELMRHHQAYQVVHAISSSLLTQIAEEAVRYKNILKAKKETILNGAEKSYINEQIQKMFNEAAYQHDAAAYVRNHLDEIVPLLLYAWSIENKGQTPRDTQLVALLLSIHSQDKGLLQQVRTGEGKTLIVGLTAAFMALSGRAVDIVSSNRDLAIEGERKCREFFKFLKLESAHICNNDDAMNKQAYQANIVYGETGDFQRDILETEFNNKQILGKRYTNKVKCLIVDEVDNMCLDKAQHVLYLSHEIDSLKWLDTIFTNIWSATLRLSIENEEQLDQQIEDITSFMVNMIDTDRIHLPPYLHSYASYKMQRWVESAFQARMMQENNQFILDVTKGNDQESSHKKKNIIPVDKDTGVEQYSTRWSDGLAQFLELQYRRKLSVESLKAVFMSNKTFFQRYGKNIYGLTGTLGASDAQQFIADLYPVQFAKLPTSKPKKVDRLEPKMAIAHDGWVSLIASESATIAADRPVLIICENIDQVKQIFGKLLQHNIAPHKIKTYARDGDEIEKYFEEHPATSGDIIIATNKGGRGTDIHVDEGIFAKGGMHVILTYLPGNERVEEQAFGRTARNGAPGSSQFILKVAEDTYDALYHFKHLPTAMKMKRLDDVAEEILEREKIIRDNENAARLSELKQKGILHLDVEGELFDKFMKFKKDEFQNKFESIFKCKENKEENQKEENKDRRKSQVISLYDEAENILKDHWAFWLDKAKKDIEKIANIKQKMELLEKFEKEFLALERNIINNFSDDFFLTNFIKTPEEATKLGRAYLSRQEWPTAQKYFEKAIKLEDASGAAYIGLAFALVKNNQGKFKDDKKKIRQQLKEAICCLERTKQSEMANLKIADILAECATAQILQQVSAKDNDYQDQVTGKLEVIGLHLHYLRKSVGEYLEPCDFIDYSKIKDPSEKDYERSKAIYNFLVEKEIIHDNRIRKHFQNNFDKVAPVICKHVDASIADAVVDLLRDGFDLEKLEQTVCSELELWGALVPTKSDEQVWILNGKRLTQEIDATYVELWHELQEQIVLANVAETPVGERLLGNEKYTQFKTYLLEKKLLISTKRVLFEKLDFNLIYNNEKYVKYRKITVNEEGNESQDLRKFFADLQVFQAKNGMKYLYSSDLPFQTEKEEANKIIMLLKEKRILKAGGLGTKYKYGKTLSEAFPDCLKNTPYVIDQDLIKSKLFALQGEIRSFEKAFKASLTDFMDLEGQENFPKELFFFSGLALDKFFTLEDDKSWWNPDAFAVAMIGLAQVIAGAALCAAGVVNIGNALIGEGINDMVYAVMASLSGNFSWKDWLIQKSISMTLALLTAGMNALSTIAKTAAKLGSISRTAMFAKILAKAAGQFAINCLTEIITDKVMQEVLNSIIQKVVNEIETQILTKVKATLQDHLEHLYCNSQNDEQFERAFHTLTTNIKNGLSNNRTLPKEFEQIRSRVMSSISSNLKVANGGKFAKGLKAAVIANKVWSIIQSSLQVMSVAKVFTDIIDSAKTAEGQNTKNILSHNKQDINKKVEHLNALIKTHISDKLTKELAKALQGIVGKTLTAAGKAAAEKASDNINKIRARQQAKQEHHAAKKRAFVEQPTQHLSKKDKAAEQERNNLQQEVQHPKIAEINDTQRALGRADIKMLADRKRRTVKIYNEAKGKMEVIRPHGLRQVVAAFRRSAHINYQQGKAGQLGHFKVRQGEQYVQREGGQDCLTIAYKESLGQEVDANMVRQQREKLAIYTLKHKSTFFKSQLNIDRKGHDRLLGGTDPTWKLDKTVDVDLSNEKDKNEALRKAYPALFKKVEELLLKKLGEKKLSSCKFELHQFIVRTEAVDKSKMNLFPVEMIAENDECTLEINMDDPKNGEQGPTGPHLGFTINYKKTKDKQTGHILLNEVPASRSKAIAPLRNVGSHPFFVNCQEQDAFYKRRGEISNNPDIKQELKNLLLRELEKPFKNRVIGITPSGVSSYQYGKTSDQSLISISFFKGKTDEKIQALLKPMDEISSDAIPFKFPGDPWSDGKQTMTKAFDAKKEESIIVTSADGKGVPIRHKKDQARIEEHKRKK